MSAEERVASSAMRPNHALTLLRGGEQLFPALVEAIMTPGSVPGATSAQSQ